MAGAFDCADDRGPIGLQPVWEPTADATNNTQGGVPDLGGNRHLGRSFPKIGGMAAPEADVSGRMDPRIFTARPWDGGFIRPLDVRSGAAIPPILGSCVPSACATEISIHLGYCSSRRRWHPNTGWRPIGPRSSAQSKAPAMRKGAWINCGEKRGPLRFLRYVGHEAGRLGEQETLGERQNGAGVISAHVVAAVKIILPPF